MQVQQAVLHSLEKSSNTQGEGSVTVRLAESLLPNDEMLLQLCGDLCSLFNKTNVGYGTFGDVTDFPARLQDYSSGQTDLMGLSTRGIELLKHHMQGAFLATGGYVLFAKYTQDQSEFLLLAMLKQRSVPGIGEDLRLLKTINIDLSKLHEAARVNLTRRSVNEQPYLSFVKGQAKSGKVTDYFRDALACTSYTDPKFFTEQAIAAAKAFVNQLPDKTPDEKREEYLAVKKRLVDCFDTAKGGEVPPQTMAVAIAPNDPEAFVTFAAEAAVAGTYHANTPFKPHPGTYRALRRISGAVGSVKVSFDVKDLETQAVIYDAASDALLIKHPGESLREKIRDAVGTT